MKKIDEAIAVFQRTVELYPASANAHDSLGDGYENAGKLDMAEQAVRKAIELGASDPKLDEYKDHLKRLTAEASAASGKTGASK